MSIGSRSQSRPTIFAEVLRDLGGALLFGVPLVYTMEIWWLGETSRTSTLAYMTLVGALASGVIRFNVVGALGWFGAILAGFRCTAMSLALALGLSFTIGTLALDDSATMMIGEAAAIGIPLALGAALGSVLFRHAGDRDGGAANSDFETSTVTRDLAASALGAIFIALPIAPTGEIPTISSMTDTWRVLAAVPVAVLLAYAILFASGFLQHRRGGVATSLEDALVATFTTSGVGLIVATALLYGFGVLDTSSSISEALGYVAALSIPAVIGARSRKVGRSMNMFQRNTPTKAQERARLVVGLIGVVIVVGFVAAAGIVDHHRGSSPPRVRVVTIEHASSGKSELFTATVENAGDITAEQVVVRGTVGDDDPVDHEIDFLAPGEQDEVSFTAPHGTAKRDVTIQVLAWTAAE